MFDTISCFITGDTIELNNQVFRLGELSEDILNISREEFFELDAIRGRLENFEQNWRHDHGAFESRVEMQTLRRLLLKRKLFRALESYPKSTELDKFALPVWAPENLLEDEPAPILDENNEISPREIMRVSSKYQQIVHDIYAFNNAMFWFIDRFVKYLDKMDKDNYAEAFYRFSLNETIKEERALPTYEERIFTVNDTLSVQYVPRKKQGGEGFAIYECFKVERLQSFLKLDFYRALMAGHVIRRCKNCDKFFLLTQGFHTEYCDRPIPDKPHRNCRNQGAKNIAKEKTQNNPVLRSYQQAYNRVNTDYNRRRISKDERNRARAKLVDLRDEAISGKYRDAEVDALMQPGQLYPALGIERK